MILRGSSILLILLLAGSCFDSDLEAQAASEESGFLNRLSGSLQSISERVGPAVVQIFASGYSSPAMPGLSAKLLTRARSSGSGVIVSRLGHTITNAHVVQNARRIQVRLAAPVEEGSPFSSILKPKGKLITAEIVGIDRETDLAVLRIAEPNPSFLEFGNSDDLRQGQMVLAFGSPLGLENSVTLGVVSSVARQLRPEDPMIYVQTDAPINPGNSGGPLVDTSGRIVGINTLILSQSGGNEGIGLAAPSNIVKHVYQEILENGRVRRGQLGISVQTITPNLHSGLRLSRSWGVIVADVQPGGSAHLSGLEIGDVIVKLDGKVIENARQLEVNVYGHRPGDRVKLEIIRGSETLNIQVGVIEREDELAKLAGLVTPEENLIDRLGILAIDINSQIAQILPPPRKLGGVLVAARAADAPFWDDGLLPGDVIYQVNKEEITGLSGLRNALKNFGTGDAIVLQVQREGRLMFVPFQLD